MKKIILVMLLALSFIVHAQAETITEDQAREILDGIYKGDYREAFATKNPELFLKHIPDDFTSVQVDGQTFNAEALRQFFSYPFYQSSSAY